MDVDPRVRHVHGPQVTYESALSGCYHGWMKSNPASQSTASALVSGCITYWLSSLVFGSVIELTMVACGSCRPGTIDIQFGVGHAAHCEYDQRIKPSYQLQRLHENLGDMQLVSDWPTVWSDLGESIWSKLNIQPHHTERAQWPAACGA